MSVPDAGPRPSGRSRVPGRSLWRFREVRARLRRPGARLVAVLAGLVFAVVAMTVGGMIVPGSIVGPVTIGLGPGPTGPIGAAGELVAITPWGIAVVPVVAGLLTAVVAGSVGTAASIVGQELAGARRARTARPWPGTVAVGSVPTISGIAALGACCCGSCAIGAAAVAVGGTGLSAGDPGASGVGLLLVQLAAALLGLLAIERRLAGGEGGRCDPPDHGGPRRWFVLTIRVGLLVAALTWAAAVPAEWLSLAPAHAGIADWYHWLFEHGALSTAALAVALFPSETGAWLLHRSGSWRAWTVRVALVVPALTWGLGVPPPLTGWGLGGGINEVLGLTGLGPAWGGVPPDTLGGPALAFHWLFQHLLLSAFAGAAGAAPRALGERLRRWEPAPSEPGASPSPTPPPGSGARSRPGLGSHVVDA